MITLLFLILLCFIFVALQQLSKFVTCYTTTKEIETADRIDKMVDEITYKAYIIAHETIEASETLPESKEREKMNLVLTIVADVMLKHGIKPKDYNIPALLLVTKFNIYRQLYNYTLGRSDNNGKS